MRVEERPFVDRDHALSDWQGMPEGIDSKHLPIVVFLEGDGSLCQEYRPGLWQRFTTRYTGDYVLVRPRTWVNTVCETEAFRQADFVHRVEETVALIDSLVVQFPGRAIFLVGHSAGAHLAILAAQKRPDRIRGIVNLGGSAWALARLLPEIDRERARRTGMQPAELETRLGGIAAVVKQVAGQSDSQAPFWGRNARFWNQMFFAPVEVLWRDSTLPMLIVHGEQDFESVPFSAVRPLREEWANRRNVTFRFCPNLGHDLLRPEVFLEVNRWIAEQEKARGD